MTDEKVGREYREMYIEELLAKYTRRELDEIARGLGLNPSDYLNKGAIAEAVLRSREREEELIEEKIREYPRDEVKEEVKRVSTDTVKGKIKAIENKTAEFHAFAPMFQQSVQEQTKENEDVVKKFQQSVQEQVKENEQFVKEFYG